MNRQESFEAHYADQHDVPIETMAGYRWKDQDGYRLPGIASAYQSYCAGWDAGMIKTFEKVKPHLNQCLVCAEPGGHGGLPCPNMGAMLAAGTIVTKQIQLTEFKGEDHEQ